MCSTVAIVIIGVFHGYDVNRSLRYKRVLEKSDTSSTTEVKLMRKWKKKGNIIAVTRGEPDSDVQY